MKDRAPLTACSDNQKQHTRPRQKETERARDIEKKKAEGKEKDLGNKREGRIWT